MSNEPRLTTSPLDAQALAYELMQRSYPNHHHLMGPPPEANR